MVDYALIVIDKMIVVDKIILPMNNETSILEMGNENLMKIVVVYHDIAIVTAETTSMSYLMTRMMKIVMRIAEQMFYSWNKIRLINNALCELINFFISGSTMYTF